LESDPWSNIAGAQSITGVQPQVPLPLDTHATENPWNDPKQTPGEQEMPTHQNQEESGLVDANGPSKGDFDGIITEPLNTMIPKVQDGLSSQNAVLGSAEDTSKSVYDKAKSQELQRQLEAGFRSGFKSRTIVNSSGATIVTKSRTLSDIQNVFTDPQKIAYVGLCYVAMLAYKNNQLGERKKAIDSYDKWSHSLMVYI
jgi:hypothetical protein